MASNILKNGAAVNDEGGGLYLGSPNTDHTVQVSFTGSITALTVELLGSLDGANWFVMDSHAFSGGEITAKIAIYQVNDLAVEYVKEKITAVTGTGVVNALHVGK